MTKDNEFGNPYDPPQVEESGQSEDSATERLVCPICGQSTDSLKQYICYGRCFCLGILFTIQRVAYRGCPLCMRRYLWQMCVKNIIPANLLWLLLLLPQTLLQVAASRAKGHSPSVLKGIHPETQLGRRYEFSEKRVLIGLAVALIWFAFCIVFGLLSS
jgi:hypothetical protein